MPIHVMLAIGFLMLVYIALWIFVAPFAIILTIMGGIVASITAIIEYITRP